MPHATTHRAAVLIGMALAAPTLAQTLTFPEGAEVPASMTAAEAEHVKENPITATPSRAAPPALVRTPGEYEPAEGIMFAYEGPNSWKSIISQMVRDITTIGDATAFVFVDTASEQSSAFNAISSFGADMSRVSFHVRTTDTIWLRDYGPRYVYLGSQPDGTGGVRAIIDHTYNRPRPNDNAIPSFWSTLRSEPSFLIPLVHGGGNYHLETGNPGGVGHSTNLIVNENPGLSASQIIQHWRDYQNLETTLYTPYPAFVDSTQHIDMWMIMLDDDAVMISEWVNEPTASWAITSNNAAADFQARGFTVYRVPAVRSGGTHYTFTNAVICNDLVLVPRYTNSTASQFNDDALAVWQAAYPGKTISQINCQALVTSAGVMHCIVMHVPATANGDAPGLYMNSQNDQPVIEPGDLVETTWLFDSPEGVTTADLFLSNDGGATFPTTISTGFDGTAGSYYWVAPDIASTDARLRLVIRDADGNETSDVSDASFSINGTACTPDLAEPFGTLNFFDISTFITLYNNADPAADLAEPFGTLNFFDISTFIAAYNAGCP
ncbi:MAG: agmatine deiminase family protein [Phycisphaerales bacterium]